MFDDNDEALASIDPLDPDQAISKIIETFGNDLKRFIYTYVYNEALTNDILGDVLATVHQKLDTKPETVKIMDLFHDNS